MNFITEDNLKDIFVDADIDYKRLVCDLKNDTSFIYLLEESSATNDILIEYISDNYLKKANR